MKFMNLLGSTSQAAQSGRRASRRGPSPLTVVAAVLFTGFLLCGQAAPALCSTTYYVYTAGAYQDVTSEIQTTNGHTYVMSANPFEVIVNLTLGHVYDIDGCLIGYITDGGPPPAGPPG